MKRMNLVQFILVVAILAFAGRVLYFVFKKNLTLENAIKKTIEFGPKKVLEKQEPEGPIPDDAACIIDNPPAFDFKGEEVVNPRDIKCKECNNYVHKEEDNMCSPYKYRDDGYCVIDKKVKEMCPF